MPLAKSNGEGDVVTRAELDAYRREWEAHRSRLDDRIDGCVPLEQLKLTDSQVEHISLQVAERGVDYTKRFDSLDRVTRTLETGMATLTERIAGIDGTIAWWGKVVAALVIACTLAIVGLKGH